MMETELLFHLCRVFGRASRMARATLPQRYQVYIRLGATCQGTFSHWTAISDSEKATPNLLRFYPSSKVHTHTHWSYFLSPLKIGPVIVSIGAVLPGHSRKLTRFSGKSS